VLGVRFTEVVTRKS